MNRVKYLIFLFLFVSGLIDAKSQNSRIDGYKGIWYTIGQNSGYGDKYSGGLGTYTADHIPVAVYAPEADKTFFVYGGTTRSDERHLLIMISYYDHKKKIVPKPVVVYDKNRVDDPHDNGSVSIDSEGYIWVFVSGRNVSRLGMVFKSDKPYSIDRFEKVYESVITYPQPWWMGDKGFMHLFTKYTGKNRGRELYWSVSPDGKTWTPDKKLAGIEGHYQISNTCGDKIVTAFNYHPDGEADKRTNIYLVQTEDMGKSWQTAGGNNISVPLTDPLNPALVYNCKDDRKLVYLNDLNFDRFGNPVILAVVSRHYQPGPQGDPREWMVFHWKNNSWRSYKICNSTGNYDMGSLYVRGKEWIVIGPTAPGPQRYGTGGEMVLWKSKNEGENWVKVRDITSGSRMNNSYARRPLNARNDFFAFWADGNADKMSESRLYFTNKSGSKVWMLPYNMETDFEKPVRIR